MENPRASSLERPRRSFALTLSPLVLARKSVSYDKLPDEPIRLSILKLDASSFNIEVAKTANIAGLKTAVEEVFSHLPREGPGKVSWPHVWGHFCLCYNGQKLVVDSEYLKDFGVKDGDQLHFMRHVSISYNLVKKKPGKRSVATKDKNTAEKEEEQKESERSEWKVSNVGCFMGGGGGGGGERSGLANNGFLGSFKKALLRRCFNKWRRRNIPSSSSSRSYLVNYKYI